jgi:Lon protease-like protein
MSWPPEIGVMVLPKVILFPQAYLPLYVFEQRYRKMLRDSLESHRLFCVSMQVPERKRESPAPVAGLGLVRAARQHADGTSHVILQGLTRVELGKAVRYSPYRTHRINVLSSRNFDSAAVDALTHKLIELVGRELNTGSSEPGPLLEGSVENPQTPVKPGLELLAHANNPEQLADLVSWALLTNPRQRQVLLETLDVEARLRQLIRFLLAERQDSAPT